MDLTAWKTSKRNGNNDGLSCNFKHTYTVQYTMSVTAKDIQKLRKARDDAIRPNERDDLIDSYDIKDGRRVDVFRDDQADNPFTSGRTLGRLVVDEDIDGFSDTTKSKDPYSYAMGNGAILAISVIPSETHYILDMDTDPKNTAKIVIYATTEDIQNVFGKTGASMKQIIKSLENDIKEYGMWENGDVLAAQIWDEDGLFGSTCSWYENEEDIKKEWK